MIVFKDNSYSLLLTNRDKVSEYSDGLVRAFFENDEDFASFIETGKCNVAVKHRA